MSEVRDHMTKAKHFAFLKRCTTCKATVIDPSVFENDHAPNCKFIFKKAEKGDVAQQEQWKSLCTQLVGEKLAEQISQSMYVCWKHAHTTLTYIVDLKPKLARPLEHSAPQPSSEDSMPVSRLPSLDPAAKRIRTASGRVGEASTSGNGETDPQGKNVSIPKDPLVSSTK
jgi:hypothetical protein